jgi:hypothetical protein
MQLVSYQYSSEINRNHQNNVLTVATGMITPSRPLLLCHGNIHTKMDTHVTSKLPFGYFTYAQKDNEIIVLMQLVSYQNLSRINKNHRNNILTVATSMMMLLWS